MTWSHLNNVWLDAAVGVAALQPSILSIHYIKSILNTLIWPAHQEDGHGQEGCMDQQVQAEDENRRCPHSATAASHHPLATRIRIWFSISSSLFFTMVPSASLPALILSDHLFKRRSKFSLLISWAHLIITVSVNPIFNLSLFLPLFSNWFYT